MNEISADILGRDLAEACTGEVAIFADAGVLDAVSALAAALAAAEGEEPEDVPHIATRVRQAFSRRSQKLYEGF